jgi:LmbE family N-acetylglucosaminyl deacetylase
MKLNKILVLSPHTDDAELGCGGTIIKFLEEKKQIKWIVFSVAEDSLPNEDDKQKLKKEFLEVCKSLNLNEENYSIYHFPVRNLDKYRQDILEILVKVKREFNPDLVLGPSQNDYHQDHKVVSNEMIRAFKMQSSILCYELPWNHIKFTATYFEILQDRHVELKLKILKNYQTQVNLNRFYFSDDVIKGILMTRGSQINTKYAEAFDVIRIINI